ncbi:HNH endonuclease [Serratia fonticola]|uniref:HNH endonuclease n=1 Tax=Serratia fonticola TaxID=47917 RepID=UPI0021B77EB0|nr:HNH endonuclease [Serratia fonticola]
MKFRIGISVCGIGWKLDFSKRVSLIPNNAAGGRKNKAKGYFMSLSKTGYPDGERVRAVWDCCHDLYVQLGRAPTSQEFKAEINRREPDRVGISTHSRQWGDWMRYHGFSSNTLLDDHEIPDEYLEPNRLRVVYAVRKLGEASAIDVINWIMNSNAPLKANEIRIQLDALTVNSNHRYRYLQGRTDTRSDKGHPCDTFYRSGELRATRYVEYIPELHGVWDIADDGKTPIKIVDPWHTDAIMHQLRIETCDNDTETTDDDFNDARVRAMREAVIREGQPIFRRRLMAAYQGKCPITGSTITALLEAAHIRPYAGAWHCEAKHGILLKTDIHTLFDKGLLWLDDDFQVCLAPMLLDSEYAELLGRRIELPNSKGDWPLREHLARHREFCTGILQ